MSSIEIPLRQLKNRQAIQMDILEAQCKGCRFCVQFCPKSVLAISSRFNSKGYYPPEVVNAEACIGCGLCEMVCPDFAIFLTEPSVEAEAPCI